MNDLLYWLMLWKQAKSMPQAVFQGVIGGLVFGVIVFAPLWFVLLEFAHD